MTALAACLFVLAAIASGWIMAASARRYGPGALSLRTQLEACPGTLVIWWRSVERQPLPACSIVRCRQVQLVPAPALEWPVSAAALTLAA
jgi:hypothetical protein